MRPLRIARSLAALVLLFAGLYALGRTLAREERFR